MRPTNHTWNEGFEVARRKDTVNFGAGGNEVHTTYEKDNNHFKNLFTDYKAHIDTRGLKSPVEKTPSTLGRAGMKSTQPM